MENPWRFVRVLSNCENKVVDHLAARSVENYLPQITQKSEWTDRTVMASRPLFPGYVFARFDRMQKVLVQSAPGVIRNGIGEVVPEAELERIRTAFDQGWKLAPHPGRTEGKRVRFRNGVFAGVEGTAIEVGTDMLVVLTLSGSHESFSIEARLDDLGFVDENVS